MGSRNRSGREGKGQQSSQRTDDRYTRGRTRSTSEAKRRRVGSDNNTSNSEIADFLQSVSRDENSVKLLVR